MTLGTAALQGLLPSVQALLVDFDGPICRIFAGYRAPAVADEIRSTLAANGYQLEEAAKSTDDPLELLRRVADIGDTNATATTARLLRDAELRAVGTARPTPGGHEVLVAAAESGRRVAVVSNNSSDAVLKYLLRQDLLRRVVSVVSRYEGMAPSLMKPNTHLLLRALDELAVAPEHCVMVGDSVTDVEAAQGVGAFSIGLAKDASRVEKLASAGADLVITTMVELADCLRPAQI